MINEIVRSFSDEKKINENTHTNTEPRVSTSLNENVGIKEETLNTLLINTQKSNNGIFSSNT